MQVAEYETEEGPARQVVTYYYDVENRWIGQTTDRDGDGTVDHTRWFGYDGQQMLVQFDREGGGRLTAQDQSYRYLWGPAVDQILADEQLFPLATEEGTSASFPLPPGEGQGEGAAHGGGYDLSSPGRVLWPLADHLGTVRDLAQYGAASGMTTVVKHRQYDSYGNLVSAIDPATNQAAAVDFLFGFTGRPLDSATGLENNTNRWYDAAVGRWLSQDPLGLAAGDANLYRYVRNAPTVSCDFSGLILDTLWDAANIGLGLVSLGKDLWEGRFKDAAADGGALALDIAATVVPFVPGGASTAAKVARGAKAVDKAAEAVEGVCGVSSPESGGDGRFSAEGEVWGSVEEPAVCHRADGDSSAVRDIEPVYATWASAV